MYHLKTNPVPQGLQPMVIPLSDIQTIVGIDDNNQQVILSSPNTLRRTTVPPPPPSNILPARSPHVLPQQQQKQQVAVGLQQLPSIQGNVVAQGNVAQLPSNVNQISATGIVGGGGRAKSTPTNTSG